MNFQQAKEYRDEQLSHIGKSVKLKDFNCRIEHLIIAPAKIDGLTQMKIFSFSFASINVNEETLRTLGFINDDLTVFVVGVNNNVRYHKPLSEYLRETKQPFSIK